MIVSHRLCMQLRCCAGVCALGQSGRYVVGVSTVAEFFGASCIMLVILWKEIEMLLDTRGARALLAEVTWTMALM